MLIEMGEMRGVKKVTAVRRLHLVMSQIFKRGSDCRTVSMIKMSRQSSQCRHHALSRRNCGTWPLDLTVNAIIVELLRNQWHI